MSESNPDNTAQKKTELSVRPSIGYAVLVTDRQLLPIVSGNRLRILGLIRAFRALGWKLILVGANLGPIEELKSLVDGLVLVNARSFYGGELKEFNATAYRHAVERVAAKLRPSVVIAEYAWLAPGLATLPQGIERWIDCHDVLHERNERFRAAGLDPWTICTANEEAELLGIADTLITCQLRDAEVLRNLAPDKRVVSIYTPIDLAAGFKRSSSSGNTVLAVGANHPGNEAICDFARQVWPKVLARVPAARLEIVGGIGASLHGLPGVDAIGFVQDLQPHYAAASVVVCPVTVGSGVKTKMLEGLRYGKAVVVTTAAEEGLSKTERRAWITTDTLEQCADAVVSLLVDHASRGKLEDAAFAFGEQHLSSEAFQNQIRAILPNLRNRSWNTAVGPPLSVPAATQKGWIWLNHEAQSNGTRTANGNQRISVIIRNVGNNSQLRKCLRALLSQTYAHESFEVIVVDNSSQSTPAVLCQSPFIIRTGTSNANAPAARNYGAALARGDVIAFIDSDYHPKRDWLKHAIAAADPLGKQSIVVCQSKPGRKRSGASALEWYQAIAFRERKQRPESRTDRSACGMIVPQKIWKLVGPFDEEADGLADRAWTARAISQQAHIAYAPRAVVVHPLELTKRGLRQKTLLGVQAELRSLENRGETKQTQFWPRLAVYTTRLKRDLNAILKQKIPWRFRPGAVLASAMVWYWSVNEIRNTHRFKSVSDKILQPAPQRGDQPLHGANLCLNSVTIIVPCSGWVDTLLPCVESLRAQVVDVPVEIILVINRPRSERGALDLPGVTVVYEPRPGPAAARNAGVRASSGDLLAFIDSDCIASPQWVSSALASMRNGAGASIIAGAITRSGARQNWVSFYDSVTYLQQEKYVNGSRNCVTANLIVHRSVFDLVGPFDESFNEAAFEDWDWTLRAGLAGVPVVYEPASIVDHPCMSTLAELKRKAERLTRGRILMQHKSGARSEPQRLFTTLRSLLRVAYRNRQVGLLDRVRLMCVACAVGFWQWRAARLSQHLKGSN